MQKGRIFPQLMPLWKSFPLKLILLQTQGFLPLMYPWGMFPHIEITTLMVEAVLVEEKASAEEEVPKGLGSAIGGTSVKATTPLKEGASIIRSQPKGTLSPLPFLSYLQMIHSLLFPRQLVVDLLWWLPCLPFLLLPPRCPILRCHLTRPLMMFLRTQMMSPL